MKQHKHPATCEKVAFIKSVQMCRSYMQLSGEFCQEDYTFARLGLTLSPSSYSWLTPAGCPGVIKMRYLPFASAGLNYPIA